MTTATEETAGIDFAELLERFKAKFALIPVEYHVALGWLYVYRQIQDQRKRLQNRATQLSGEGDRRVFWANLLSEEMTAPMSLVISASAGAIKKSEAAAAAQVSRLMGESSWYTEVASPAARGVGMSTPAGALSAAKILDAYGSVRRFGTFGQIIRYSRLAPEDGKAPRRASGKRIKYNPRAWQALFDLSEVWNRLPTCHWRLRWDAWKEYYRAAHPDEKAYPKGRIHNMARRKVLREFLHELWDLWHAWEDAREQT